MRRLLMLFLLFCFVSSAPAATGRVIKVLPHLLDLQGRHMLSPSLYERDAYQAFLRQHTNQISGMRFDIQWRAKGSVYAPLRLRLELIGSAIRDGKPARAVLEKTVKPGRLFSHWTTLPLLGENYATFGRLTAWRATLWEGDRMLSEQKSFLW